MTWVGEFFGNDLHPDLRACNSYYQFSVSTPWVSFDALMHLYTCLPGLAMCHVEEKALLDFYFFPWYKFLISLYHK